MATNISALLGGSIKSIQRGMSSLSMTSLSLTIAAVNTAKSELRILGFNARGDANPGDWPLLTLTNSTSITISKLSAGNLITVSWELTEWY